MLSSIYANYIIAQSSKIKIFVVLTTGHNTNNALNNFIQLQNHLLLARGQRNVL